ncbi:hypothetical protein T06_16583 [Trichinella sp. T6]|nr:hypothetical protein T06_16583 [Trichinella sp. T6]
MGILPRIAKVVDIDPLGIVKTINGHQKKGTKQRDRLNLKMRGLPLKLTTLQPNITALAATHQTHPSHQRCQGLIWHQQIRNGSSRRHPKA